MEDPVDRALGYPYPRPEGAYAFRAGEAPALDGPVDVGGTLVVAYGSNAAPAQLVRKFADLPDVTIRSWPGELLEYDVVYAAQISYYGSVPATVASAPGTRAAVFLQDLPPPALARMHETEGLGRIYSFEPALRVRIGGKVFVAAAWVALAGPLLVDGRPAALAEVAAAGRALPALGQREVQERVRRALAPGERLAEFIRQNVADPDRRRRFSGLLGRGV